jgi:nicotinamide mononucleotide (NMN) deamidase PncC
LKNANGYNESDIRKDYHNLTKLLIEKNMTITTMESATSGQIASLITDTEGSSAILKGAFITYCNEAKIMQGVPAEILDKYTVYSKETASSRIQCSSTNVLGTFLSFGSVFQPRTFSAQDLSTSELLRTL